MSRSKWLLCLLLIPALVTPAMAQQAHVADEAMLRALVQKKLDEDAADRAAVKRLFQRPEVLEIAQKLGLKQSRIEAVSGALDGEELRLVASYARAIDQDLTGGQWGGTVTWFAIIAFVVAVIIIFIIAG